jgi:hypothetical protein
MPVTVLAIPTGSMLKQGEHSMSVFIQNKYTNWYYSIINKALSTQRKKNKNSYFENHHIIPRSIGGINNKSNLVLLTFKEHFLCHWLLTKICINEQHTIKMKKALFKMTTKNYSQQRITAGWQIDLAKRNAKEAQIRRWQDPIYREKQKQAVQKESYKQIKSEKAKAAWQNEKFRSKLMEALLITQTDPIIREKRRVSIINALSKPETKQKISVGVRKKFKDKEWRDKFNETRKIVANDPITRKNNSEAQQRPEVIAKKRASLEITNKNPEVKAKRSQAQKEVMQRKEYKEKVLNSLKLFRENNQKTCPHCGKICDPMNASKWHFDKCKKFKCE